MNTHNICLICSKNPTGDTGSEVKADSSPFNVYFEQNRCLNQQLIPIFVLRSLLQYPSAECENLLTLTQGISNPGSWFVLCSNCTLHVKNAFNVHQEIVKLRTKFDTFCQQLKNLLQNDLIEETRNCIIKTEEDVVNFRQVIRKYFRDNSQLNAEQPLQLPEVPTCDGKKEKRYLFENIENPSSSPPSPLWNPVESFSDNNNKPDSESDEDKDGNVKTRKPRSKNKLKSTNRSRPNRTRVPGRVKCKLCKNMYSTESIRKHLKRHVLYKRTTCQECLFPARNESILNLHMNRAHPNEELSHQSKSAIDIQIKISSDETQIMKENTPDNESEKQVSMKIIESRRVICDICKIDYSTESIRKHLRRHKLYKETTCKECSFPARNQTVLNLHMLEKHDSKVSSGMTPSSEAATTEDNLEKEPERNSKRKRKHVDYKYSDSDEDIEVNAPSPLWNPGSDDNESNCGYEEESKKDHQSNDQIIDGNLIAKENEHTENVSLEENQKVSIKKDYGRTRVTCDICKNDYSADSIRKHLHRHRMYKETTCKECHFPAKNQLQLDYHIKRQHTPQSKIKPVISTTNKIKKLRKRYRKHGKVKCKICNFEYSHNSLLQHMDRHKWYKDTSCSICKFPTKDNSKLVIHLKRHHPDSPELASLEKIITNSKPVKKNICQECGYIASSKSALSQHRFNHQIYDNLTKCPTTGNFICKHCQQSFDTVSKVQRHLRENHEAEVSKGAFHCELCGSWYFTKGSLQFHHQTFHKNQQRYYCEQCGKGFMNLRRFEDHQASHLYTPGCKGHIICDNCGLDFKSQISLKQHQQKFHWKSMLTTQVQKVDNVEETPINTDESLEQDSSIRKTPPRRNRKSPCYTKYPCTKCGVVCINSRALKLHLKEMHKELYIYNCDMCDASYMRLPSLRIHQTATHTQTKAKCPNCDKEFSCPQYLQQHLKLCKKNTNLN